MAIEEMRLQQKQESDRTKAELENRKLEIAQLEAERKQLLETVSAMKDTATPQHNPHIGE